VLSELQSAEIGYLRRVVIFSSTIGRDLVICQVIICVRDGLFATSSLRDISRQSAQLWNS